MYQAIIYNTPGYLPILHTMREEAWAKRNAALADAISLLIVEYTSHQYRSEGTNRARRQAIQNYTESAL